MLQNTTERAKKSFKVAEPFVHELKKECGQRISFRFLNFPIGWVTHNDIKFP